MKRRGIIGIALPVLALWFAGFAAYLMQVPTHPADPDLHTDAIVTLTGPESGRLWHAFDEFTAGAAPRLLISGVEQHTTYAKVLHLAHRDDLVLPPMLAAGLVLGRQARDTVGNAEETRAYVCAQGLHSIRLITADDHMPRALWLMRLALPHTTILPDPLIWPNGHVKPMAWIVARGLYRRVMEYQKDAIQHALYWLGWLKIPSGCR